MVQISSLLAVLAASALTGPALAHPGEKHDLHHIKREKDGLYHRAVSAKRALGKCSNSLAARQLENRSIARRSKVVRDLRAKRGVEERSQKFRRDLATLEEFEAVNHNMTGIDDYNPMTDPNVVFAANTSCILAPEVTDGPYYVTGETIRKNVKEDLYSDGVDLYLEVQYVDVNTCEPIPDVYVDIWNANATGVYSGISESGNYAAGGWNSTYLRGIQVSDKDGVVAFETIFPGHYAGRATHTHLLAHTNVTLLENNTISGGAVAHIGQLFYPESLIDAVEATYPYSTNTQSVTTNDEDMWTIVQAADEYDPFPEFVYLGSDVSQGLFAWVQIGINKTADYTDDSYYSVAAVLEADGGHATGNTVGGGDGSGGSPPNGTAPSNTTSV